MSNRQSKRDDVNYRCELASRSEQCMAGPNTILISDSGQIAVRDELFDTTSHVPMGTVATLWISPENARYILVIHRAAYFGDAVENTLLTPNQMRHHGITVDDVPRQFDARSTHSIYDPVSGVRIPLIIRGVFSGFTSFKPTVEEYNTCPKVTLTSEQDWMSGATVA